MGYPGAGNRLRPRDQGGASLYVRIGCDERRRAGRSPDSAIRGGDPSRMMTVVDVSGMTSAEINRGTGQIASSASSPSRRSRGGSRSTSIGGHQRETGAVQVATLQGRGTGMERRRFG